MKKIVFLLYFISLSALSEENSNAQERVFTEAKIIKKITPIYPESEAGSRREGWVTLSYVVSKEGAVIDPVVIDSSGNKIFEGTALRTVRHWVYEPAMLDGEAVEQSHTKAKITFFIRNVGKNVRFSFSKKYKKIAALIKNNNLERAAEEIEIISKKEMMNLSEDAWFWWLKTQLNLAINDKNSAYKSLLKALAFDDKYLPKTVYKNALIHLYKAEIEQAYYADALETLSKLEKLLTDKKNIEKLGKNSEKIKAFLESPNAISVNGKIGDQGVWIHKLNRREFNYQGTSDNVAWFEIRCDRNRQKFKFSLDNTWKIPKNWGDCTLFVYGEIGASVKIIEHPS